MRICRFNDGKLGLVEGDKVLDVTKATEALPACRWPFPLGDLAIRELAKLKDGIESAKAGAQSYNLADVKLLSPVPNPSKVIAAPLNYVKHVDESAANPEIHQNTHQTAFEGYATPIAKLGLFLKANSSVIGPGEGVDITFHDRRNDHEVELAVVIGKEAKNVSEDDALDYVAGYCIGLDMTVRGPEERSFRKSQDTFTVLGPYLVTAEEISNPSDLDFWIKVNGETKQAANTSELTVGIKELIALASTWFTLYPGDVIVTGTPDGVNRVVAGDVMEAYIEEIGTMTIDVR